ncbi:aminotransferase class I/II-fold pyridoxal phosphate-dependent enzyme, partial [Immundisolibacter sp.]|uniref:aminotransferase class I/II-fold pyridoxal phosphate-dependent enzyme n=1 Tax=Immundisolibacter sp. TaxID=1934948 RepID=UPI00262A7642
ALPVAIDAEGMRPEALEAALAAGAQAVLCTPRAHNPTGCSLGASRAKALRAILARHPHVLVIEDDHFALLARTPYFSIVPAGACRWALVRSVSKALGPDLRLALVASDAGTAERLHLRLAAGTAWVSHLLQTAVRRLLGDDAVLAQLRTASDTYARRRQALIDALREADIAALEPCEGLNVWVPLPPGTDAAHLAQRLAQAGWLVRTAEAFAITAPRPALRLTASTLEPATAARFARQLAEQLGAVRRRR